MRFISQYFKDVAQTGIQRNKKWEDEHSQNVDRSLLIVSSTGYNSLPPKKQPLNTLVKILIVGEKGEVSVLTTSRVQKSRGCL